MMHLNQTEIIENIKKTETLTAVEIIRNHENPNECSIIINDRFFSVPYETEYSFELLQNIKNTIPEEVLMIMFNDDELPKAWAASYTAAGIPEERHDRRVKFHAYNDMNEMFCIDQNLLWNITDEFKGTEHELTEENGSWMWHITKWYKNHLI